MGKQPIKFKSFREMIDTNAKLYGDKAAIVMGRANEKDIVTYKQMKEAIDEKVERFRKIPFRTVAISAKPNGGWILHCLAAAIAGKKVVLLDHTLDAFKTRPILEETDTDFFYCDSHSKFVELGETLRAIGKKVHDLPSAEPIEEGGNLLFYTSGTTSHSKAVVLTQEALLSSCWNGQLCLPCDETDTVLSMIPLHVIFGFICTMLWPLCYGASVAISRGPRRQSEDPVFFEPTIITMAPGQLRYLLSLGTRFPKLRSLIIGAGPADPDALETMRNKGVDVRLGYGMTETSAGMFLSRREDPSFAMFPCQETTYRVTEDGELYVKTSGIMKGYYHRPADTMAVLSSDGEFETGDLVSVTKEGGIHVLGRKQDVLVLPSGHKVFCPEEEKELAKRLGTQVALTIRNGDQLAVVAIAPESLRDELEERLWRFNKHRKRGLQITRLELRDEPMPRTQTGKIQRYLL